MSTTVNVTTEGDVTVGVEYNPVAGSGTDTNIGITRSSSAVVVTSSSGTSGTILAADGTNAGVFTSANYTKLAGISGTNTGDQNIFKNIAVAGQSTVVADSTNDTLTLVAGTNITLTTDAATDTVTITAAGGGGTGDVVGPASATNGAFALFDTTTGKLLKNGSIPGGAATLNVGTTAGTVAAGDDSRLTNARTPTSHASTHVTGGTDAIQSATSSQNGLATSTQITKLDGIEAGADVTDATNVAAAGAVMKTLADAKGDLFAATAADTVTRLPIGVSNGHVLTVDSAETTGMKWTAPSGSGGDVVGPASSTDNAFARFDSTTGKLLQNSTATLDDVGLASLDAVQFATSPTTAEGAAKAVWNATNSCLSIGLNSSVTSLVGTDSHVQVYNESASTMTVMQVVRQSGSSGTRLSVELALANTDANSATSIGVVAQTIASHAQGFIQTAGLLQGVNTNAFLEGDTLWLSPTTAGLITNVRPTAPNHSVRIGYCIKKAVGAGIILIDILNGFEIGELHDVVITEPVADNSFLTYDTASSVWINEAPSTAKSSIGLGSVTNDAQTKAAIVPNTAPTAGQLLVGNAGGTAYAPVSLSSDATVASTGALTLATVNSNVGAFGSATQSAAITVNAKGLVTAVSASTVTPAVGSITGLGTGVATALAVNVGSAGAPVVNGGALGTPSSGTLSSCTGLPLGSVTGLGTGVATALAVAVGSAGAPVINGGALGTPSSGTLSSCTGLSLTTGVTGDLPLANLAQASAASKLLGRGSASGAGDFQEITLGTNLSMSGTTLNATGGGGSSPQPVQSVLTTTATTTSTTYADITGLTASYTPTSVSQKVLVRGSISFGSTSSNQTVFRLARDGTALTQATASGSRTVSHAAFLDTANGLGMESTSFEFLDTPGTTSAVTYSIQWKRGGSSGTCYLNRAQDDLDYDSRANTVSTLTVIPFAV